MSALSHSGMRWLTLPWLPGNTAAWAEGFPVLRKRLGLRVDVHACVWIAAARVTAFCSFNALGLELERSTNISEDDGGERAQPRPRGRSHLGLLSWILVA